MAQRNLFTYFKCILVKGKLKKGLKYRKTFSKFF